MEDEFADYNLCDGELAHQALPLWLRIPEHQLLKHLVINLHL